MQCPNCESINRDSAKFCDECGFPLTGALARNAFLDRIESARAADEDKQDVLVEPPVEEQELPVEEQEPPAEEPEVHGLHEAAEEQAVPEEPIEETVDTDEESIDPTEEIQAIKPNLDVEGDQDSVQQENGAGDPASSEFEEEQASGQGTDEADRDESGAEAAAEPIVGSFDPSVTAPVAFDEFPLVSDEAAVYQPTRQIRSDAFAPDITMQMPRIESDDAGKSRDYLSSSTKKKKRTYKPVLIFVAVIAVIAIAIGATYMMGIWGGKVVPNVTGMTESDARIMLEDYGFEVKSLQVKSDDTEGLVLLMDPGAGSRLDEGSEVVIHVAAARTVPDLAGKTLDSAKALLEDDGYETVTVQYVKSDGEENVVESVSPEPGTRAKSNTEIVLTVTQGYHVPDVIGLGVSQATEALDEEGLQYYIYYVDTDQYADGTVIGCNPESGTKVQSDEVIALSVARARGLELEQLTASLLAPGGTVVLAGYTYEIQTLDYVKYQGNDTVAFQGTGRPMITFFGETLYASGGQPISGLVVWSPNNTVISIT